MGTLYGMVFKSGDPAEGIEVTLIGPNGESAGTATSGDDGSFTFDVTAGTWTLTWRGEDGAENEGSVEVPEGEDAEVEIEI